MITFFKIKQSFFRILSTMIIILNYENIFYLFRPTFVNHTAQIRVLYIDKYDENGNYIMITYLS